MQVASKHMIKQVLNSLDIKALKKYGQNFLSSEETATGIVNLLALSPRDNVVEIGPGLGALTHYLVESGANITAVEIDKAVSKFLEETYAKDENFIVIQQDFLRYQLNHDLRNLKVIGNLPYYITTPIVEKLIKLSAQISEFVVMVQAEVIRRFDAKVNEEEYGPLAIMLGLLGKGEAKIKVSSHNFYPQPTIASQVYHFTFNHSLTSEEIDELYRFVTAVFTNRRKSILNNLTIVLGERSKAAFVVEKLNLNCDLRPENIEPAVFVEMVKIITEQDWLTNVTYPRPNPRS